MKMGKYTGITSFLAIPMDSSSYVPIQKCAPVTDQVVIGTPGTIKKWTSAKKLGTRDVKILVFDEADHMLAEVVLTTTNFIVVRNSVQFLLIMVHQGDSISVVCVFLHNSLIVIIVCFLC